MTSRFKKFLLFSVFLGGLGGAIVAGLFLYELVMGPRMRVQVHLLPWEALMPAPPAHSVPLEPRPEPGTVELPAVSPTPDNLARSRTYYAYYCLFCHGEDGRGNGPVGGSYMPVPSDLRAAKFRDYSDSRLVQAMLTGTGHEPVLPRVVPPEHRPWLLLYLRNLQQEEGT